MFSLLLVSMYFPSPSTTRMPFFSAVDEIAVNNENLFALDNTFNQVYVFSLAGEFQYIIPLSPLGQKYIFCENEKLVVYNSGHHLLEYYEDGIQISEEPIDEGQAVEGHDSILYVTFCENEGKTFSYEDRSFFPSKVNVSGSENYQFVVESFLSHVVWKLLLLVFVVCFFCGGYSLFSFFKQKTEEKKATNSNA
ncbi:MAG: hypothetical protein WC341_12245 [Bacteroidales bacterium]|jgi:hypothetical protein